MRAGHHLPVSGKIRRRNVAAVRRMITHEHPAQFIEERVVKHGKLPIRLALQHPGRGGMTTGGGGQGGDELGNAKVIARRMPSSRSGTRASRSEAAISLRSDAEFRQGFREVWRAGGTSGELIGSRRRDATVGCVFGDEREIAGHKRACGGFGGGRGGPADDVGTESGPSGKLPKGRGEAASGTGGLVALAGRIGRVGKAGMENPVTRGRLAGSHGCPEQRCKQGLGGVQRGDDAEVNEAGQMRQSPGVEQRMQEIPVETIYSQDQDAAGK